MELKCYRCKYLYDAQGHINECATTNQNCKKEADDLFEDNLDSYFKVIDKTLGNKE